MVDEKAKAKNMYGFIREAWNKPKDTYVRKLQWERLIEWRKSPTVTRVEHPTRLDRARALGYKAKQGYIIVRARVRRGGLNKPQIRAGRKPKRKGIVKITMKKSIQRIAEERANKHYPNMEVLNSYWVGQDGRHKYYEVILVDRSHPVIKNDPKISWISNQRGRAQRGKTRVGQKNRGLTKKGRGSENSRPSVNANK
ncbi:MAG: 50S ribosomal protein L15e [Thermoplasmata archaeon]